MNNSSRYPTKTVTGAPIAAYRIVGPLSLVLDCLQETRLYRRLLLLLLLIITIVEAIQKTDVSSIGCFCLFIIFYSVR